MAVESIKVVNLLHPGSAGGRARGTPRGRQVNPAARAHVEALLGDRPRRRDLLLEYLHTIQDHHGHLSAQHLAALADLLHLAQAEVYEVATFYAHFDVVREGDTPPPAVTIRICDSLTCELHGARHLLQTLPQQLNGTARVVRAPCMGRCDRAPVAVIGQRHVDHAAPERIIDALRKGRFDARIPTYPTLDQYRAAGGYELLQDCLLGRRERGPVIADLQHAALRGLGGAGFPTGRKWDIVRGFPGPRLLAVNADEGEPGTFKDRHYLETDPHRVLEGMLVAAWVVEAETIYFYLRDEYPAARTILTREIRRLQQAGLVTPGTIELRRGAGAYICGEESAMLESIEGKRGLPRHRPPYVAEQGLFGRPTLVNNVETLYWVRDILQRGSAWFAGQGRRQGQGLRSYSVSGRVRQPGVKLAPAGITVRELIDEYCGGMAPGHRLKAYLPGGASGGLLPAGMDDLPLDFGQLEPHGCFVGSHAVVILSDRDDIKAAALNLMRFFEDESCGQCTPCRIGTEKAVKLMTAGHWDRDLLQELGETLAQASICGLGQAAANPLQCLLRYFPEDIEE